MKIQSTNEQICNYLKQQIADGTIEQGQQLNLNQIAELFGVSVTPVRDAVNILIYQGFIDKVGNKMFIHRIPEEERSMLEKALVTQLCAGYRICLEMGKREELIAKLESVLKAQDSTKQEKGGHSFDTSFDTAIVSCTENKFLIRNVEKDFEYYEDLMYLAYHIDVEKQRVKSRKEHEEMIRLIKEQRDDEFCALMETHYRDTIIKE
ncbi:MAG: GntR family transcriptional regulator [Firmicutes bacterium]|nr:GntR family transcriptional regulator [Bacillota bacterium]